MFVSSKLVFEDRVKCYHRRQAVSCVERDVRSLYFRRWFTLFKRTEPLKVSVQNSWSRFTHRIHHWKYSKVKILNRTADSRWGIRIHSQRCVHSISSKCLSVKALVIWPWYDLAIQMTLIFWASFSGIQANLYQHRMLRGKEVTASMNPQVCGHHHSHRSLLQHINCDATTWLWYLVFTHIQKGFLFGVYYSIYPVTSVNQI